MVTAATRYPPDPRALFILVLCVISGAPLIVGRAEPLSLEALLPSWAVVVWGCSLVFGAGMALVGMFFQSIGGVITEQIGSIITGVTCIFYAVAIILFLGMDGSVSAAIIVGWGIACLFRWAQLQKYLQLLEAEVRINNER